MQERATGLILRIYPLTDTSLIIHWLTPDLGRISTAAKGARRPKSPFHGALDLFFLADFSFHRSRHSDLHTLREVSLRKMHAPLRENLASLQQAAYCAALIEQTTETETPLPKVFALLSGFLSQLLEHGPQPVAIFSFEAKLLGELGLAPNFAAVSLSPGSRNLLAKLAELDWSLAARLKMTGAQAQEISQFLRGFLIYHVGKVPKGRNVALNTDHGPQ